jgi:hypothetical protein
MESTIMCCRRMRDDVVTMAGDASRVVDAGQERTAVLVIRLWQEHIGQHGFRARITQTRDIEAGGEETTVVRSLPQLLETVRRWAIGFERDTGPPKA